jgi:ribonuclease J
MGEQGWSILSKAATLLNDSTFVTGSIKFFRNEKQFNIYEITITPYLMDHSAFDAFAFHITDSDKSVIYTGDFRSHGRKGRLLDSFLKNVPKKANALIMEGTMLSRKYEEVKSEEMLQYKIEEICSKTSNIVFGYCSSQNIDRLVTFYKAARKTGRIFAVDIYTAHILKSAAANASIPYPGRIGFTDIRTYYPHRLSKRIAYCGNEDMLYKYKNTKISKDEIRERRSEILMIIRPSAKRDIELISGLKGASIIYSLWVGYMQNPYTRNFIEWLEKEGCKKYIVHTSGHATVEVIRKVISTLQPQNVIPVHTTTPQEMGVIAENTVFLNDGEPFTP